MCSSTAVLTVISSTHTIFLFCQKKKYDDEEEEVESILLLYTTIQGYMGMDGVVSNNISFLVSFPFNI